MNAMNVPRLMLAAAAALFGTASAASADAQQVASASSPDAFIGTFMPHGLDSRDYVDDHLPAFRATLLDCYMDELDASPTTSGMLVMRMYIAPNGTVTGVDVLDNRTGSEDLAICAQEEIEALDLAANHRPNVSITLPVSFLLPAPRGLASL
jgi:hypothetical protein